MKKEIPFNHLPQRGWLDAKSAASYLSLAVSSFYCLVANGTLPRPTKLGARSRWRLADLDDALQREGGAE